ncbi:uncharacterized protein LOC132791131 isoform X1 [Drosophila nasuta]|uniref:uncharacterized protein LOC132791131 isoform X1 n=1 Tax=Drosophila nasuta TaxID=42062 RepID=UPI00295E92F6|nr:uncharacterized protein LOC132791131 isoform X1 [Drosophila nasuta]
MVLLKKGFVCLNLKVSCLFIAIADVIFCTIASLIFHGALSEITWSVFTVLQLLVSVLLVFALGYESYNFCIPYLINTFARLCWTTVLLLVQFYDLLSYGTLAMATFILVFDTYFWFHVYSVYLIFGGEALCWV